MRNFNFVNYDDSLYVYDNPHLQGGLTWDGIIWAFTADRASNWHPLTWVSHMLDCQVFGLTSGWMHLENVLLHLVNTLLLFAVFRRMTGALWSSAFVAAAFALHPMHVESVAWIAERKDVLSTLFLLLTVAAYLWYASRHGTGRYLLTVALFACGLMAKPMLITLPFLLLLLDYWPLGRFGAQGADISDSRSSESGSARSLRGTLYGLVTEKILFFILAAASGVITLIVQQGSGAVRDIALGHRVANALVSYTGYIGAMLMPRNLAVFYPLQSDKPALWQAGMSLALLAAISIAVFCFRRNHRYLLVGWLWFVGTLVPVIGLIQVGDQAYADRYTYIPYTGLFVMAAWGLPELLSRCPGRKTALGLSMIVVLSTLGICSYRQVSYWRDSLSLFRHAVAATQGNYLAYHSLGTAYYDLGRYDEQIEALKEAIRNKPDYAEAYNNLGNAYGWLGRYREAIDAHRQAARIRPDYAEVHYNLANELISVGNYDEGEEQLRVALRLRPHWPECMSNLADLLATCPQIGDRNADEAVQLASRACESTDYSNPLFLSALAAAYANAGRFGEAVDISKRAADLVDAASQPQLREMIQRRLWFYERGRPYVEPAPGPMSDSSRP